MEKRIKILMLEKDVKQVDIVRKYGFDRGDISKVIKGTRKTPKIQSAIASELGFTRENLFNADKE